MVEEKARVIQVQDDTAWVETERSSTCSGCVAKAACGTPLLARFFGSRRTRVQVLDTVGVQSGDYVVIGLHEDALARGSLAIYGFPLAGLLGGALMGHVLGGTEWLSILSAMLGFFIGLGWLRWFAASIARDEHYQARVLRRFESPPATFTT